jgi:hypothetical protein
MLWVGASGFVLGPFIGGLRSPAYRKQKLALLLGLAISLAPLSVFGKALKVGTHHRPLGGATYAIVAAVVSIALVLVVARLLTWAGEQGRGTRRVIAASALVLATVGAGILTALIFVRSYFVDTELGHALLDATLALGLGTVAAFLPIPKTWHDVTAKAGPWVWLFTAIVAAGLTRFPKVRTEAEQAAPVLAAPLTWLGG